MIQTTNGDSLFTVKEEKKVPLEADRLFLSCLKGDILTTEKLAN